MGVGRRDVDGGWAWVVIVAAALNLGIQDMFIMTAGIFQVEFLDHFSGNQGFVALVGSLVIGFSLILGPIAGMISDLLTHRVTIMTGGCLVSIGLLCASFSQDLVTLLVLYGVVTGVGYGLSYTPSVTVVSFYFHKYRVAANGVMMASTGVGIIVGPYLFRWLIINNGWRVAMAAVSFLSAQMCVLGALMFPQESSLATSCFRPKQRVVISEKDLYVRSSLVKETRSDVRNQSQDTAIVAHLAGSGTSIHVVESEQVANLEKAATRREKITGLLGNRFMWMVSLNQMLMMLGYSIHVLLFPAYAETVGISLKQLPSLYTALGAMYIVSRVCGGLLFNLIPNHLVKVLFVCQSGLCLVLLLLPVIGVSMSALTACMAFIGTTHGLSFMLVSPILAQYIGLKDLSVAFGITALFCGLASFTGPPVAGATYDYSRSYNVAYYIAGSCVGCGVLLIIPLLLVKGPQPTQQTVQGEETLLSAIQNGEEKTPPSDGDKVTAENDADTNRQEVQDVHLDHPSL